MSISSLRDCLPLKREQPAEKRVAVHIAVGSVTDVEALR